MNDDAEIDQLDEPMEQRWNPILPTADFWKEQMEVYIGPEGSRHRFFVHPELLTHSTNYFKGALRDQGDGRAFMEAEHKRVEIERLLDDTEFEDDREIFSLFLWTLFRGKLEIADLWYGLDQDRLPEREIREESYLRLMRVFLLAEYFDCAYAIDLLYDKLVNTFDATADWSGANIGSKAVALAWEWLPSDHPLIDEIKIQWYGCSAEDFQKGMAHFPQGFVDERVSEMFP